MNATVYLNGRFMALDEATVSVNDRGFLFADGIYEVIRVYSGQLFLLQPHLDRLRNSAEILQLELDPDCHELSRVCREVVNLNELTDGTVYLQVTRGVGARTHAIPPGIKPTTVVMPGAVPANYPQLRTDGVSAITVADDRWARCDAKTVGLTANVLAKERAVKAGAFEAIFIRDGYLTDGASTNVFAVIGGRLLTAARSNYLLAGVTRGLVLELAQDAELTVSEGPIRVESLRQAAEIILTSTTCEVMPVTDLDGCQVGDGRPGATAIALQSMFQRFRASSGRAD